MSVEVTPATQLGFPRPLTVTVKRSLFVHNPHPHPVAFKVKTTAPKQYCVRPNSGRIEPGESCEVSVLLQPLPSEPPPHAKCKDKFLVQSAYIAPDNEMRSLGEMWADVEKTNKSAISEHKIKVAYLAAEDGSAVTNGIPEEPEDGLEQSRMMDESTTYPNDGLSRWTTAPEKVFDPKLYRNGGFSYWEGAYTPYTPKTPKTPKIPLTPSTIVCPPVTPGSQLLLCMTLSPAAQKSSGMGLIQQQIYAAASSSPVQPKANGDHSSQLSATPAPIISPAVGTTSTPAAPKELPALSANDVAAVGAPTNVALEQGLAASQTDSQKLAIALKEIDTLRAQLEESRGPQVTGLRKRGGATAGAETTVEKAKEVVHAAGTSGVPVEVVAALLVGVFVMTYLFF